ncbi:hypothetical protein MLD38_029664 [Melastoma candidum]|uniref:Uncharacterized protein n=1 Tax=Melastoma candidum TaxID=119954 RepID=A0ACB9NA26_9MYRT|nr:hypothetical protein MLD38_029664 [Melastoma candidum]
MVLHEKIWLLKQVDDAMAIFHTGRQPRCHPRTWTQSSVVSFTKTRVICLQVRFVDPLRIRKDELQVGDYATHGEEAYALWADGERLETSIHAVDKFFVPNVGELDIAWKTLIVNLVKERLWLLVKKQ